MPVPAPTTRHWRPHQANLALAGPEYVCWATVGPLDVDSLLNAIGRC